MFIPYKSLKWYHDYLLNSRFRRLFLAQLTLRIGTYLFYIKKFITQFKITEKMRGHLLVFEKMAIFSHGKVQPQKSLRF